MSEISSFRGLAGEVSNRSLRFGTVVTAVGLAILIAIVIFFIGMLLSKMGRVRIPYELQNFLMLLFPAFWVARFAIPSSQGEFQAGFFNRYLKPGDVLHFVMRYMVFTLIWYVPVTLAYWGLGKRMILNPLAALIGYSFYSLFSIKALFKTIALFILNIASIVMPVLAVLMATRTESVADTLSIEPWQWLWHERRKDIKPLLALLYGTPFVFLLVYFVPGSIVLSLVANITRGITRSSWTAIGILSAFMVMVFVSYVTILLGRLAGTFVYGEDELNLDAEATAGDVIRDTLSAKGYQGGSQAGAGGQAAGFTGVAFNMTNWLDELEAKSQDDLNRELDLALDKAGADPNAIKAVVTLAYGYLWQEKTQDAVTYGAKALELCLINSRIPDAIKLFKDFSSHRDALKLSGAHWTRLGRGFLTQKHYVDACWCLFHGIEVDNAFDDIAKQKDLLSVGHAANDAGDKAQALTIYNFFLKKFPDSSLAEFVKTTINSLK